MATRLGRYLLLKHLASGGMADVLLGRSDGIQGFERHVVIKRIRPEHARDQRFIRMFLDEARVAATLHHQHIVQVHDIGESAGEYFIAMEYIHGEDVRTILSVSSKSRAHVPLGYATAIVSAAAAGLHYAHERCGNDKRPLQIVHRDVSPSNILVGYDGSIKVVDFGIAKAAMREETRSGSLKGKISYMSPEQCRGTEVDRRSDVYALGVVLYELATTTRLFRGDNSYVVMEQIVNGKVPPPQARRPDLPAELSAIILRAIAPDRERRYATANDLRIALDQFAAKAGLTASTSAIAAYMNKQLGQRPEPWLDIVEPLDELSEDVPTVIGALMPHASWTELSRSASDLSRRTGTLPSVNDPPRAMASELALAATDLAPQQPHTTMTRSSTAVPTDVKLGWESQRPAVGPSRFSPGKLAMIGAPALAILAALAWRLTGAPAAPVPAVAAAVQPAPPPPAAPIPQVAVNGVRMPEITLQETPPAPRPRNAAAPASPRADASAPHARTDPALAPSPAVTRGTVVASTSPAAVRGNPAGAVGDLHRLVAIAPAPSEPVAAIIPAAVPVAVAPAPAPVLPPAAPQNVAPGALEPNRVAGERRILPDEVTMATFGRSGKDKLAGSYKLCITADGTVSAVSLLASTGFPAYDERIASTIRSAWRYRPYLVNGKPTPVCTAVRFVYSQK